MKGTKSSRLELILKRTYLIPPESPRLEKWVDLMSIVDTYLCFAIPYRLAFDFFDWDFILEIIFLNIMLIADVVVRYLTTYRVDILHLDQIPYQLLHFKVFKRYLKNGLVFDLMAALPWEIFQKELCLLKMSRIFRQSALFRSLQRMMEKALSMVFEKLRARQFAKFWADIVKGLFLLLLYGHLSCCMYVWVSRVEQDEFNLDWKIAIPIENPDEYDTYLSSMYYVMTTFTTVGYGDVTAKTPREMLFAMALQMLGVVVSSFAQGRIMYFFALFGKKKDNEEDMEELEEWILVRERFQGDAVRSAELFDQLKTLNMLHTEHKFRDVFENLGFYNQLSEKQKQEISLNVFEKWFRFFNPFFFDLSPKFKITCMMEISFRGYPSDIMFLMKGEHMKGVYFILRGEVTIHSRTHRLPLYTFRRGEFVGEPFLLDNLPSPYTYTTGRKAPFHCMFLPASFFETYKRHFKLDIHFLFKKALNRMEMILEREEILERKYVQTKAKQLSARNRVGSNVDEGTSLKQPIGPIESMNPQGDDFFVVPENEDVLKEALKSTRSKLNLREDELNTHAKTNKEDEEEEEIQVKVDEDYDDQGNIEEELYDSDLDDVKLNEQLDMSIDYPGEMFMPKPKIEEDPNFRSDYFEVQLTSLELKLKRVQARVANEFKTIAKSLKKARKVGAKAADALKARNKITKSAKYKAMQH
eukprot:TRINITY_DN3440_c0_g1_i6.p1 TRINITY_DN3440_c0_g1~~TRINITY_DN3440_c0_g1_i6.p1  ORF type:complete len:698 (-),score=66.10 TRINITY_DN3440_c0_g1_i6:469-2562(-)